MEYDFQPVKANNLGSGIIIIAYTGDLIGSQQETRAPQQEPGKWTGIREDFMNELLGMPEAGKRMGCSAQTMYKRLTTANVPLIRVNGRAWAVWATDLETFRNAGQVRGRGRPRKAESCVTA